MDVKSESRPSRSARRVRRLSRKGLGSKIFIIVLAVQLLVGLVFRPAS
jgi:hypothetical protein